MPTLAYRWIISPKGVFVAALVAGLVTVVAMDLTYREHLFATDSVEYVQLADSLLTGHGYTLPSGALGARIPPLYPILLAGERLLPLDLITVNGVVNALFGATTCLLLYWIGVRTFKDARVAPLAALGLAIYPFHLFNTGYVLKENLAIVALVLTVAVWIEAMYRQSAVWAVLAGVSLGLATLARYYPTVGLPIALLAGLAYERSRRPNFPWLRLASGLIGLLVLCVAPWLIHNWSRSGTPMLSTYGVGYYLYTSNGPGVVPDTSGYFEARGLDNSVTYSPTTDQWNEEDALGKALATMVDDPARTATLFGAKTISFWRPVWAGSSMGTWLVLGGSYVLMMLLAIAGARSPGPGRFRAVLWSTICLYTLVHLIFWGMIRERNYLEPFFIPFAARGALVMLDWLAPRLSWIPGGASWRARSSA
ncbi:MAG TPA: glycosyltransferase family 39 protein [Chloroflexota bacterium]